MAKVIETKLIDDLDGGVAHETVKFGLDGQEFEIDLNKKNAQKLRNELDQFISRGHRSLRGKTPSTMSARPPKPAKRASAAKVVATRAAKPAPAVMQLQVDPKTVRAWAQGRGMEVAPRGRMSSDVFVAFQEAMES